MSKVRFKRLSTPYSIKLFEPQWDSKERIAVLNALEDGQLNEGKYVREFEHEFAKFVDAKYCVFVPNGTIALYMAAKVWRDAGAVSWMRSPVRVPDYYGIFAANALTMLGREVQIIDLSEKFVTNHAYNIIPVHVNGRYSTATYIEDCCQAIDFHTGGALSCYSFHPSKLMTCGGVGGAICCDEEEQYLQLSALKDHGRQERAQGKPMTDKHEKVGLNFKMSDMNAAFGLEQLKRLLLRLNQLRGTYGVYREILGDRVGWLEGKPTWRVDCLVPNPDKVIQSLASKGIEAKRFYLPLHRQPQYRDSDTLFPNTMRLYNHGIYLPCGFNLNEEDIHQICGIVLRELNT